VDSLFEPIYQRYCDSISRADFWALLGWLAINLSSNGAIPISFQYGRKDAVNCEVPRTRLPSAQKNIKHIEEVFTAQMGLTLSDAVTLLGAHSLGHVHPEFSGYGVEATPIVRRALSVPEDSGDSRITPIADDSEGPEVPDLPSDNVNVLQTNAWDSTPQTFDNEYYKGLINVVSGVCFIYNSICKLHF